MILKREQVADKYQLPIKTVDYLVAVGSIPFTRISKRIIRFDSVRLDEWFRENEGRPYVRPKGDLRP